MPGDVHARGFLGWFPSTKVRLFPNADSIRFEGVIHELVNPSVERAGFRIQTSEIPVHHYPLLKSSASHARKARLYLELGREKAERYPDDPKAHVELGNQCAEIRDYAGAAAAYRHALTLQPTSPEVLKDLGAVLHLMGRHTEAQTALELAVRLQPDLHDAWRNLGVVHAASAEWRRAARSFRHALRLNPSWCDGHRFLSVALHHAGHTEEAVQEAQEAVELQPDSIDAATHYVEVVHAAKCDAAARTLLDSLLMVRPEARGWRVARERLGR
jgi:tetratricopeptide (TPR) repeat protein